MGGVVSAANWSEIWPRLDQRGVDADRATARLKVLGVLVESVTGADAVTAAGAGTDEGLGMSPGVDAAVTVVR